jgi:hypothetical protein
MDTPAQKALEERQIASEKSTDGERGLSDDDLEGVSGGVDGESTDDKHKGVARSPPLAAFGKIGSV